MMLCGRYLVNYIKTNNDGQDKPENNIPDSPKLRLSLADPWLCYLNLYREIRILQFLTEFSIESLFKLGFFIEVGQIIVFNIPNLWIFKRCSTKITCRPILGRGVSRTFLLGECESLNLPTGR